MPRVARYTRSVLRCLPPCIGVLVPVCYVLAGLVCLWAELPPLVLTMVAAAQLGLFLIVAFSPVNTPRPIGLFALCILGASVIAGVAWHVSQGVFHCGFPVAVVGSVSWGLVSWEAAVLWRARRPTDGRHPYGITMSEQIAAPAAALLLGIACAVLRAATDRDAATAVERVYDAFHVLLIGMGTSVFLALPWLSIRFLLRWLKTWRYLVGGDEPAK